MALEQITFNIGAFNDSDAGGNNYFTDTVFEVKNQSDNTFATIYADSSGTTQIPQNGIDNVSNSKGECNFYIDDGDFYIEVNSQQKRFSTNKNASSITTDDGGTVQGFIDSRIYPPNILDFGAYTDGTTPSDSAISAARSASNYKSQVYIPNGVFVSDLTVQQVYHGGGEVKKSNGDYNRAFIKASSGATELTTIDVSCIIRQDSQGSGWYFIEDSGHAKNGFASVAPQDGNPYSLELTYGYTADKILSITANCDEWFTKGGIKVGSSVSQGLTRLFAHKDACFSVNNVTGAVNANGFFGSTITAVVNADKTVTVTHPATLSATEWPLITPVRDVSGATLIPTIVSATATSITYALYGSYDGLIEHNGSNWIVSTKASLKPTVTADSGGLTITHNPNTRADVLFVEARDGWGLAFVDTTTESEARVILRNYDGTVIDPTVTPTNYKIYFRGSNLVQQSATFGAVSIQRPSVAVMWDNLYGTSGNFWVQGTMAV